MLNWIQPEYSKTKVKKAGKNIRSGNFTDEDVYIVENWRASHAYVLNTFQANLRVRSRNKDITVAQRLKRRHTIFDKLRREPAMQLSTMHDIAGCRVIFKKEKELFEFRKSLHEARFKHILLSDDKYNYIENPKKTGYRGVHDVYEYNVSSMFGPIWNGLRIEIQYRTIYQHAWATAVEIADIITTNRIKFDDTDASHKKFFQMSSEIIARAFEDRTSCCPTIPNADLVDKFLEIDNQIGLMRTFTNLKRAKENKILKTNTILIFHTDSGNGEQRLETETYDNVKKAISRYGELEKLYSSSADIVLVRAENEASVRDAFRNYFSDTNDFVKYIRKGCTDLT